jgi:hypothetical protein
MGGDTVTLVAKAWSRGFLPGVLALLSAACGASTTVAVGAGGAEAGRAPHATGAHDARDAATDATVGRKDAGAGDARIDDASDAERRDAPRDAGLCTLPDADVSALEMTLGETFLGFGCNTVGGLHGPDGSAGVSCVVSSPDDDTADAATGTLRYCVERTRGPTVVTFDPSLAGKTIELAGTLTFHSNTTLDGRMPTGAASVTLTEKLSVIGNYCNPRSPNYKDGGANPCANPGFGVDGGKDSGIPQSLYLWNTDDDPTVLAIPPGASQVIVTDVVMHANLPPYLPSTPEGDASTFPNPCYEGDKAIDDGQSAGPDELLGCPGLIVLGALPPTSVPTAEVVVAHSDFSACGDKCIVGQVSDRVTIAHNHFHDTYFAILVLNDQQANLTTSRDVPDGYAPAPTIRYTIYENDFEHVLRRSPRCASFVLCHDLGNVDLDWGSAAQAGFGISGTGAAEVYVEGSFFSPPSTYGYVACDAGQCAADPFIDDGIDDNLDKTSRGPGLVFVKSWALVEDGGVQATPTIPLSITPYPMSPASAVFSPGAYYRYEVPALTQASYDSITSSTGPRALP